LFPVAIYRWREGRAVTGADLAAEHRVMLLAMGPDDLRPLLAAGISPRTIAMVTPAFSRIAVDGYTYQPDPAGGAAIVLPVRVESWVTPEAADPLKTLRDGAIVDLLAFHPAFPLRWALRRDAAEWLGALEPQYLDPETVCVRRSPLAWLRAGCRGLVVLSPEPAARYRILAECRGGILAEDNEHAAELMATLAWPRSAPRVIVRNVKPRHVA
jgi:hypothetical protein